MKWLISMLFLLCLFVPLKLFDTSVAQDVTSVSCLAATVHSEASGEPLEGQRAIYDVLVERIRLTGKSACEIVLQKGQFSGMSQQIINKVDEKMLTAYWQMLYTTKTECGGCTNFYSVKIHPPSWTKKFRFIKQINSHRFYIEEK